MAEWLLQQLFATGDQPKPRFALQSTLNWMRALAILVTDRGFTFAELDSHYAAVERRAQDVKSDTGAFENLLMAMHNVTALQTLGNDSKNPYNVVRSAIIAWYYTIYESSIAMIRAASGGKAKQHAKTARIWRADIVQRNWAVGPFSLHLDTLIPSDVKTRIIELRDGCDFALVKSPVSYSDAWGAVCAYLSRTADYEKWKIEEEVRDSREFKDLKTNSFRTEAARQLRDSRLRKGHVNFLVQAFRYRGKANYRDSIYLSYGANREPAIRQFLTDLVSVGSAFLRMASCYVNRRVDASCWQHFLSDLNDNCLFDIIPDVITASTP
jgi:hypothetical protein